MLLLQESFGSYIIREYVILLNTAKEKNHVLVEFIYKKIEIYE